MSVQRPDNVYEFFLKIPPSAILPGETAPDHYTLLGLPRFSDDKATLKRESIARNTELRGWQTSNYYLWSNELLDEVVDALLVLEKPASKTEYDRQLRSKLNLPEPALTKANVPPASSAVKSSPDELPERSFEVFKDAPFLDPDAADERKSDDSVETYRLSALSRRHRPSDFTRSAYVDLFAKQRPSRLVLLSAIVGGITVLAIALGVGIYVVRGGAASDVAQSKSRSNPDEVEIEKPDLLVKLDATKAPSKTESVISTNTVAAATAKPLDAMPIETKPKEGPLPPVFANIEAKGRILSLPKLEQGIQAVFSTNSAPQELCKVFLKNLSDVELKLSTTEAYEGEPRLLLASDRGPEPGTRSWTVMSRSKKDPFGESRANAIGRFLLHDHTEAHALTFAWDTAAPEWSNPFGLLYCKLDVQVGSDKVTCNLSKPIITPTEKLDLTRARRSLALGIPPRSLASTEFLRCDLELHLGAWSEGAYLVNVNTPALTKIVVPMDSKNGDGRVELEFKFTPPGDLKSAELPYAAFVFPTGLAEVPGKVPQWQRATTRVDQIDMTRKEGFVIADFRRFQKSGASQRTSAQLEIAKLQRSIKIVERTLSDELAARKTAADAKSADPKKVAALDRNISDLQAQLTNLNGIKRHWEDVLDFDRESTAWITEMEKRYVEIEEKLEVRYSVYLENGSERFVLAETNPPPKRAGSNTTNKGE